MYKIVEIRKNEFVIYTKGFFFWNRLERRYRSWMIPIIFNSYEAAASRVKEMAAEKNSTKKPKFQKKTYMFNSNGDNYKQTVLPPKP